MSNFIKEFWDNQAKTFNTSPDVSWKDEFAIDLEVKNISKYIENGDSVLDVGCANGFAAIRQAEMRDITITGVDYSEEMIAQANIAFKDENTHINTEVIPVMKASFQVADVRKLPFEDEAFDVTYTTRVLINLPNWEDQIEGMKECFRVTKKGGVLILSEAFYEPLQLLNAMRQLKNLPPLVEHDFNRYLKKSKLEKFLTEAEINFECIDFSSVYYLGSRFFRELVVQEDNSYTNPINRAFYELEGKIDGGGFGIQQAYIIRK